MTGVLFLQNQGYGVQPLLRHTLLIQHWNIKLPREPPLPTTVTPADGAKHTREVRWLPLLWRNKKQTLDPRCWLLDSSAPSTLTEIERNVHFLPHKHNYLTKQLARDGSCEGGVPWQAKSPGFGSSRHASHLPAHTVGACPLIHRSCPCKRLHTWDLTPCHGSFTDSPEKPGFPAAPGNSWNTISTFRSSHYNYWKAKKMFRQCPGACSVWNASLGNFKSAHSSPVHLMTGTQTFPP